jgi:DNA-directed RNA polymerase subunit RPC12/RpoP
VITRGDERRDVRVLVTGTALVMDHPHDDTAEALSTQGRTQVEAFLGDDDPPPIIRCSSYGCTPDYPPGHQEHLRVRCANCGRELDGSEENVPLEQRKPCPVCGSTARAFDKVIAIEVQVASAVAVAAAPRVHVERTPADERDEAKTLRGRYDVSLSWDRLEGDLWLLHVYNVDGDLVEGGIGDNPEDALLEVYERLIPPQR